MSFYSPQSYFHESDLYPQHGGGIEALLHRSVAQQFRGESQWAHYSPKLGRDAPLEGQVAAHRVPNYIMYQAYDNAGSSNAAVQEAIRAHAHSPANITYSTRNREHSVQERALQTDNFTAAQVRNEQNAFNVSLGQLHDACPSAAAHVIAAAAHSGPGNNKVVAGLDMRVYNSAAEKRSIKAARNRM